MLLNSKRRGKGGKSAHKRGGGRREGYWLEPASAHPFLATFCGGNC